MNTAMARRHFLTAGAAGLGATLLSNAHAVDEAAAASDAFREPARDLRVNSDADVIVCGAGPAGVTAAITAARAGAKVQLFEAHGSLGGAWDGVEIVATPEQIGIRDGRRIRGRYLVEKDDLIQGARHEDAVVRAEFPVDVHALKKDGKPVSNEGVQTQPYDIPLRALIAKDVDGLMMAGRCISGDFIAHASYRVTGNAVAMGEAAGATAAVAALTTRAPQEVSWNDAKAVVAKCRSMGFQPVWSGIEGRIE